MLNQQINIIATDIHNLTLIQQGESASLPTTDELTENAVKAEEMLETLKSRRGHGRQFGDRGGRGAHQR
jgi:hypothetical protein